MHEHVHFFVIKNHFRKVEQKKSAFGTKAFDKLTPVGLLQQVTKLQTPFLVFV